MLYEPFVHQVNNLHQLKYATDEDFLQVGLSRPEVRRLRKIFHKHCPQNYLYKFKNVSIRLNVTLKTAITCMSMTTLFSSR